MTFSDAPNFCFNFRIHTGNVTSKKKTKQNCILFKVIIVNWNQKKVTWNKNKMYKN